MNKRLIQQLSEISRVHESRFPMDLYYLSERIGKVASEGEEAPDIHVEDINYTGMEKQISTSPISLCVSPEQVLRNE